MARENNMNNPAYSESGGLSFNIGQDYSNLAPLDAVIPGMPSQPLPSDFDMSGVSMPVGLAHTDDMTWASAGDSDGSVTFQDQLSPSLAGGMDAMAGLAPGTMSAPDPLLMDGHAQQDIGYNDATEPGLPIADVLASLPDFPEIPGER